MLDWLAGWNNWPFLLAFFVGLGFIGLSFMGIGKDVGGGGIDLDGDGVPDIGPDAGHDHDSNSQTHEPGHMHLLGFGWLGVGKAPLTILVETLLVSFGLAGLLVNAVARDLLGSLGVLAFPAACAFAVVSAVGVTRGVAAIFQRFMPPEHAASRKPGDFVGKVGITAVLTTKSFGQVTVTEMENALVNACANDDVVADIPRGTEVHLVGYDQARRVYRIVPVQTA